VRLVASFATQPEEVEEFAALVRRG
jgi:hypothetical protein